MSSDGYILTNNHVIEGSSSVTVRLLNGREYNARIVGTDKDTDIGVLKIDATGLTPAALGSSEATRVGEWVLAIGNPLGADLTFTVSRSELASALDAIEKARDVISYRDITSAADVAKISIIGIGMRAHPGVAQTMFRTLSEKGINIQVISTSEIKVSVLIAEEYVELAVRALHSAYELDAA